MNMQNLASALLTGLATAALVPAGVLFVECVAALRRRRTRDHVPALVRPPRLAILIPAHNEAGVVGDTVKALKAQIKPDQDVFVIADNCTDATAREAAAAGAQVWERNDPERRGKGFAISFALEQLDHNPPDVVLIVDADCRLGAGSVDQLSLMAAFSGRPVQAKYLLRPHNDAPGILAQVSSFAFLVRNLVRPLGLKQLGMPCHLTGSGMAFPWRVLREAPDLRDNLVEDLVMGLQMAMAGSAPLFCPQAEVVSDLPTNRNAAATQRRRWEHGQLATLLRYVPQLLTTGIAKKKVRLLALAADLAVPPLSLLCVGLAMVWSLTLGAWAVFGVGQLAFFIASGSLGLVALAVACAWWGFGRTVIKGKTLLMAPLYVMWKLPLYLTFFLRKRQQTWVRTERAVSASHPPA